MMQKTFPCQDVYVIMKTPVYIYINSASVTNFYVMQPSSLGGRTWMVDASTSHIYNFMLHCSRDTCQISERPKLAHPHSLSPVVHWCFFSKSLTIHEYSWMFVFHSVFIIFFRDQYRHICIYVKL